MGPGIRARRRPIRRQDIGLNQPQQLPVTIQVSLRQVRETLTKDNKRVNPVAWRGQVVEGRTSPAVSVAGPHPQARRTRTRNRPSQKRSVRRIGRRSPDRRQGSPRPPRSRWMPAEAAASMIPPARGPARKSARLTTGVTAGSPPAAIMSPHNLRQAAAIGPNQGLRRLRRRDAGGVEFPHQARQISGAAHRARRSAALGDLGLQPGGGEGGRPGPDSPRWSDPGLRRWCASGPRRRSVATLAAAAPGCGPSGGGGWYSDHRMGPAVLLVPVPRPSSAPGVRSSRPPELSWQAVAPSWMTGASICNAF